MDRYDKVEIEKFIISAADDKYRDFNSKLTKTAYLLNGVRIPILRKYAKGLAAMEGLDKFFDEKPPCYEFCMLKGMTLGHLKNIDDDKFFRLLTRFIQDIDDWAVTDTACCAIHRKDEAYRQEAAKLALSGDVWQARWGIVAIMTNFFDRDDMILQVVKGRAAEGYYVDMAIAWLIQVLCVKNRGVATELLQADFVSPTVKKYAVRKIKDSLRISKEDKEYFCALAQNK